MSDSIRPIRVVPQMNYINPKGRAGDKKDKKEEEKGFSKHMSSDDKDVDSTEHNHVKEESGSSESANQNNGNTLSEKDEDDFDNSCGSLLDTNI
jgi:hypothetical protein